jgi:hypothetical protein
MRVLVKDEGVDVLLEWHHDLTTILTLKIKALFFIPTNHRPGTRAILSSGASSVWS